MAYPSTLDDITTLYQAVDLVKTTLNGALSAGASTITVASTTNFPTSGILRIDGEDAASVEFVSYSGVTSTTFTGVVRGTNPRFPDTNHADLTVVYHVVAAAFHNSHTTAILGVEQSLGLAPHGTHGTVAQRFTDDEALLPTATQHDALVGTSGTPSTTNCYVTDADPRMASILPISFLTMSMFGGM